MGGVTVADDHLAEVGSDLDAWHRESGGETLEAADRLRAPAREALLRWSAAHPVIHLVLRLGRYGVPGAEFEADVDWATTAALARRDVLAYRAAGLDHGMAEHSLRLIERICSLIASWPEPAWSDAVSRRVEELVNARRRGRERGARLRQSRAPEELSEPPSAGWLVRHPADHYFRLARAEVSDPWFCAYLDDQIAEFAPSYAAMAGLDWTAEEGEADLVVELQLPDQVPITWKEPVPAVVLATHHGSAGVGAELPLWLVADPDGQFNGKLVSLLAGETWLTCARLLDDGSLLPADGTRRLSAPSPAAAGLKGKSLAPL
jgi:hypothetical protein